MIYYTRKEYFCVKHITEYTRSNSWSSSGKTKKKKQQDQKACENSSKFTCRKSKHRQRLKKQEDQKITTTSEISELGNRDASTSKKEEPTVAHRIICVMPTNLSFRRALELRQQQ